MTKYFTKRTHQSSGISRGCLSAANVCVSSGDWLSDQREVTLATAVLHAIIQHTTPKPPKIKNKSMEC